MSAGRLKWKWREAVWASDLTANQKLVAQAISQYTDRDGSSAWPAVPTLAADTSLSDRTVQRSLESLVELGWLRIERRAAQHRPTTYGLVPRGDTGSGLRRRPGVTQTTPRGDTRSPDPRKGPQRRDTGGLGAASRGDFSSLVAGRPLTRKGCERCFRHEGEEAALYRPAAYPDLVWCKACVVEVG
jgi:hypothetical protein